MEVEANRFAALLLFPIAHFRKDVRRRSGADIQHVIDLARRYDMSKEATARRYVDIHDEPCAVIVSRHGIIQRIYRGPAFPFVELGKNDPIPARSITARCALAEGAASDLQETDAAIWLPSGRGQRLPKLYEQALPQNNGFSLTLLTIDAEEEEAAEEDADLEESWVARFRR